MGAGAAGWRGESYSYDGTGNRTMSGYSTGTGNRLLSDGSFNYTYDADGNMVTKTEIATGKVTTYTWDYRNRLTSVTVKDSGNNVIQQSNYTYDPFDRRIGTSFDPDGAGPQPAVQTWTVYDGTNPYADFSGSGSFSLAEGPEDITLGPVRLTNRGVCALFPARPGPVTLLSLLPWDRGYQVAVLEGEAVSTGMVFAGNPLRVSFPLPTSRIIEWIFTEGIAHHWMAGYGHVSGEVNEWARLCGPDLRLTDGNAT